MIDNPEYSDWFQPKNIPAEIPLPERTQMALANKPVRPECEDFEPVDGLPDFSADEKVEASE